MAPCPYFATGVNKTSGDHKLFRYLPIILIDFVSSKFARPEQVCPKNVMLGGSRGGYRSKQASLGCLEGFSSIWQDTAMNCKNRVIVIGLCFMLSGESATYANSWSQHHPKLVKAGAVAGMGAVTGGVGGVILGAGLIHGAIIGAGTHLGFHAIHEKWKQHHRKSMRK